MTLQGHKGWSFAIAWSPDRKLLASGSGDAAIKIWNPQTGECVQSLEGHNARWVCSVVWSPDGKWIASGSVDQTLKLWNSQTGECVRTFTGHKRQVISVAFHPDGTMLASNSEDETIKLWDIQTEKCLKTLRADRPYESMNITSVKGLTEGQKATLKALGRSTLTLFCHTR